MNKLLKNLIEIAPLYAKALDQDVAIGISDTEQYLALFSTGNLQFPFPVGTKLKDSGFEYVIKEILKTGEPYIDCVSKEVTGTVPIKTIVSPIYDKEELIGCISVSINLEKEQKMKNYSSILSQSIAAMNQVNNVKKKNKPYKQEKNTINGALTDIQNQMVQSAIEKKKTNKYNNIKTLYYNKQRV